MIRVLYAGSPSPASLTLKLLLEKSHQCGFEIVGVLTNPPSSQGRHKTLIPTPVETVARENNIPVFNPEHLDGECREEVRKVNPDILVCFAYGHIFGPKFMGLFRFGGINLHPSPLPKYRGCTPVNACILNQDKETAFTIQKVSAKMDEGNIMAQEKVSLTGDETSESLLNDAASFGAGLFCEVLKEISDKDAIGEGIVQEGRASYTGMITKEDARIDWSLDCKKIDAMVRGYYGDPCAWTMEGDSPLKIYSGKWIEEDPIITEDLKSCEAGTVCLFNKAKGILVRCGKGFYAITNLQRQGKKCMDHKSFMNGAHNFIGTKLS